MCNDYGNHIAWAEYREAMDQLRLPLRAPAAAPNLEPRDEIWPSEVAPVIRPHGDGVELAQLRWGFPAPRPGARAVINMRSEGRRFGAGRCLVPASHFFEFTGSRSPKTRWRFTRADGAWLGVAGLWRPGEGGAPDAFTMLTTAPGPDVAPIHDRQIVVLERADWAAWLNPAPPPSELLLRPSPAGTLLVAESPRGA